MENYLMLDGKKYELSPALVNALRSVDPVPEKQNPFKRGMYKEYFTINGAGKVNSMTDTNVDFDINRFATANYCTDRSIMEQRALHETLDRLLWRYSAEHGLASGWDYSRFNYRIYRRMDSGEFITDYNDTFKCQGAVYFCDEATAVSAIEEVIKPFIADHPDFIW